MTWDFGIFQTVRGVYGNLELGGLYGMADYLFLLRYVNTLNRMHSRMIHSHAIF